MPPFELLQRTNRRTECSRPGHVEIPRLVEMQILSVFLTMTHTCPRPRLQEKSQHIG